MFANVRTIFFTFIGSGLLFGFSAIQRNKKRLKTMVNYTITATITKIDSDGKVILKGMGKHLYEDSNKKQWNLLEEFTESESKEGDKDELKSKVLKQNKSFELKIDDSVPKTVLAMAMLQKKPLKLTISDDGRSGYTITEIEVP
jgi:hypothetical protein